MKSAALRKNLTDKELKIMYRQRKIKNFSPSYYPEKSLLKAINGWQIKPNNLLVGAF